MKKNITSLEDWKKSRTSEKQNIIDETELIEKFLHLDINELLARAKKNKRTSLGRKASTADFKKHIEGKIHDLLIERKLIGPSFFLCGIYVANLLAKTINKAPMSWYAFDFQKMVHDSGNPFTFRDGGDVCFLIASVFPERGNWRLMNLQYYKNMGAMFYFGLYQHAGLEIGYHMSTRFDTMAEVTHECFDLLV